MPKLKLEENILGHLILVPTPGHKKIGDFDLTDGLVRNVENPALTFSGIALYRPELLGGQKPGRFPLAPILREAADRDQLSGSLFDGVWEDAGTPERVAALNQE